MRVIMVIQNNYPIEGCAGAGRGPGHCNDVLISSSRAVSITHPFKLMERPFLRDVSFYVMSGFWAFYIFWRQEIRIFDAVGFLVIYIIYIVVVVVGRYINQKNRLDVPYLTQVTLALTFVTFNNYFVD